MNGFYIDKCLQFIDKEPEQITRQKEEFLREVKELFYYLFLVSDSLEMVFQSQGNSLEKKISVSYYLSNQQLNLNSFIESLRYLQLNPLSSDNSVQQSSEHNQLSISRKMYWTSVGNNSLYDENEDEIIVMPLMKKVIANGSFMIPIVREVNFLTDDYKWKHLLNVFSKIEGSLFIKVEKFEPKIFDVSYALQCLNYYTNTYQEKVTPEEYTANTKVFQGIIGKQDTFRVNISFRGENSEALKLAFARDLNIKAFELSSSSLTSRKLSHVDREEKEFIDRLQHLWLRDEIVESLLTPPYTFRDALAGMEHSISKPFIVPYMNNSNLEKSNNLLIGTLSDRRPIYLNSELLRKHVFATGSSGSGKTHTIHHLLYQIQNKIPFLIIDPAKREYEELMKNAGKEKNIIDFINGNIPSFNPFIPPDNITVYSHSAVISKVLALLCPTNDVAFNLILNMVRSTYIHKLIHKLGTVSPDNKFSLELEKFLSVNGKFLRDNPTCIPNFDDFLHLGMEWLIKNVGENNHWGQETIQYFKRRWEYLKISIFKKICSGERTTSVDSYFQSDYLIELYAILDTDESNAIFALMVSLLYEYRMSEGIQGSLQHLTVLEEAHRIIPAQQQGLGENRVTSAAHEAAKLLAQMLAEIRAYGEGIIVVDQSPSKIISDVLINSSTLIIHRCGYGGDKDCLSAALSLTEREKDYLSYLPTGDAIAYLADTYQPIYLTVPK
jgi:hypothetical protein